MARIRVFVSFDRENDADLVVLLRAQSKRSGSIFELVSQGPDTAAGELAEESTRSEIQAADEVVVLCGEHTRESKRVATELGIAREVSKPYLLVWGRREKMCTKPEGAGAHDAMYRWTRDVLESQIAMVLENAKPRPIPDSCKRVSS